MAYRPACLLLAGMLVLAAPGSGAVETSDSVSRIESRLPGRLVPDLPLQLADGRSLRLTELAAGTPLLEWLRESVRSVGGLDADYRVLALSFDDADTAADLRAQAAALGLLDTAGWSFAVAERDAVAQLAGVLDFWYQPDPVTGQFDHPALVVAMDRGRVVDAIVGGPGGSRRLRSLVATLRGEFISAYPLPQQVPFRCLTFDPATGTMRLDWGMALLVLPALAAMAVVFVLFGPVARRRQRAC